MFFPPIIYSWLENQTWRVPKETGIPYKDSIDHYVKSDKQFKEWSEVLGLWHRDFAMDMVKDRNRMDRMRQQRNLNRMKYDSLTQKEINEEAVHWNPASLGMSPGYTGATSRGDGKPE